MSSFTLVRRVWRLFSVRVGALTLVAAAAAFLLVRSARPDEPLRPPDVTLHLLLLEADAPAAQCASGSNRCVPKHLPIGAVKMVVGGHDGTVLYAPGFPFEFAEAYAADRLAGAVLGAADQVPGELDAAVADDSIARIVWMEREGLKALSRAPQIALPSIRRYLTHPERKRSVTVAAPFASYLSSPGADGPGRIGGAIKRQDFCGAIRSVMSRGATDADALSADVSRPSALLDLLTACARSCGGDARPSIKCCEPDDPGCISGQSDKAPSGAMAQGKSPSLTGADGADCTLSATFLPRRGTGQARARQLRGVEGELGRIRWQSLLCPEDAKNAACSWLSGCRHVFTSRTSPRTLEASWHQSTDLPPVLALDPPRVHLVLADVSDSTKRAAARQAVTAQLHALANEMRDRARNSAFGPGDVICVAVFASRVRWYERCVAGDVPRQLFHVARWVNDATSADALPDQEYTDFHAPLLAAFSFLGELLVEPAAAELPVDPGDPSGNALQPLPRASDTMPWPGTEHGSGITRVIPLDEGVLLVALDRSHGRATAASPPADHPLHLWLVSDCRPDVLYPKNHPARRLSEDLRDVLSAGSDQVMPVVHVPRPAALDERCQTAPRSGTPQSEQVRANAPCCELLAEQLRQSGELLVDTYAVAPVLEAGAGALNPLPTGAEPKRTKPAPQRLKPKRTIDLPAP